MKSLYIANCTEYEAGWGQRPDGFKLALTLEVMRAEIMKDDAMGSSNCYWRHDTPQEVMCDDDIYEAILKDMGEKKFVNYSDKKKKELHLYKKL